MILESGLVQEKDDHYELTGPLHHLAIPSTLHDSLMARLDRLSTPRELAQLGAVVGREFSYELLHAISTVDETTLQQGLAQLVDTELVYQRGLPPRSVYVFKHALIQDAAYQALLRSTRQQYHQRIAQVLEARFPEAVDTQPELLAHHFTEASLNESAVGYWQRAGQRATERSANVEAISHLTKGLDVLQALPESPERLRRELTLQTILAQVLKDAKGYGHPAVEQAYTRAQELCRQIGETPQLFTALLGLSIYFVVRAELQTARELGAQLLRLAQRAQDPVLLVEAYYSLGVTCFWLGEFAPAREYLEQGIVHYDPQRHGAHLELFGQDGGAVCLCRMALVLWYLGYPDQALARSHEALILARELSHPFSQRMSCSGQPCCVTNGGRYRQHRSGQTPLRRSRPSGGFHTGQRKERSCRAGHSRRGDSERRALRRCTTAWMLFEPQGRKCYGRTSSVCLPMSTEKWDRRKRVLSCWRRRWR